MTNLATKMTAKDIAAKLNANGYDYYGEKARGWEGDSVSRIYFGGDWVTIEADGRVHNDRKGSARASTIGWSAVEAVEAIING